MAKVACLLGDGFEDSEFREPYDALKKAGNQIDVIGAEAGKTLRGKKGKESYAPERSIDQVSADEYDALLIPGGHSPDQLRADPRFVQFVRDFARLDRPLFAVCHGPQLLMSAGLVDEETTLTAWKTIQDDLRYTGATVKDEPVVIDGTWVTSRQPDDLPQFCQAIVQMLQRAPARAVAQPPAGMH